MEILQERVVSGNCHLLEYVCVNRYFTHSENVRLFKDPLDLIELLIVKKISIMLGCHVHITLINVNDTPYVSAKVMATHRGWTSEGEGHLTSLDLRVLLRGVPVLLICVQILVRFSHGNTI